MKHPILPNRIENDYALKLRKVALIIGNMIESHAHFEKDVSGNIVKVIIREGLMELARNYAGSLDGWANAIASTMLSQVENSNKKYWLTLASHLGASIRSQQQTDAIAQVSRTLVREQVTLIKSLPLEAAKRAQDLALEATTKGKRAADVARQIMDSGDIAKNRANTIARTEIHKANAAMTEARAKYVGSSKYIWRTAGDEIVRESHAAMEGVVCDFDDPPTLDDGDSYNAGEGVNCRCFSEPII